MSKDAMKLALEALETSGDKYPLLERKAITALRYALAAQPAQQEPAATAYFEKITGRIVPPDDTHRRKFPMCYRPLVFGDTTPPARKPLSVDEIFEAIRPLYSSDKAAWLAVNHSKDEYRAIEAKHGIKENT